MSVLWSLSLLLLVVVSCVWAGVVPKANDYHVIGLEQYGAKGERSLFLNKACIFGKYNKLLITIFR